MYLDIQDLAEMNVIIAGHISRALKNSIDFSETYPLNTMISSHLYAALVALEPVNYDWRGYLGEYRMSKLGVIDERKSSESTT